MGRDAVGELPLAVTGKDHPVNALYLPQVDLGPLAVGSRRNPACRIAVGAVVEVFDGVLRVAGDTGRGFRLRPLGQRQVLGPAVAIDLQLVDAGLAATAGLADAQPHQARRHRLEAYRVGPVAIDHRLGGRRPPAGAEQRQDPNRLRRES